MDIRRYFLPLLISTLFATSVYCDDREGPWWDRLRRQLQQRENEPSPIVVDNFMTPEEAETLLQRYEPLLKKSLHLGESGVKSSNYRTSRSIRLPPMGDPLVFEIEKRASTLAGFNHSRVEDFQLACYSVDELYGLHRDDSDDHNRVNRAATVLLYLKSPEKGGSTLFTRRALEEERDLDTKGPLRSEAGALKLFRKYCDKPSKKFVVVEPQVGRAATWVNWYGVNATQFAKKSTHGACHVVEGKKCVIQQWITKSGPQPLRDESVAAIFTLGADLAYRRRLSASPEDSCQMDVSTHQGHYVSKLCLVGDSSKLIAIDESEGPYPGIGGLRIYGGLTGSLSSTLFQNAGFTVSFWARNFVDGTTLISVGVGLSLVFRSGEGAPNQGIELTRGKDSSVLELNNPAAISGWLWFSLVIGGGGSQEIVLRVYSRKEGLLGSTTLEAMDSDSCQNEKQEMSSLEFKLLSPGSTAKKESAERAAFVASQQRDEESAAFVQRGDPTPRSGDVSFVVFHSRVLDSKEAGSLRHEAKRYDLNL